MKVMLIRSQYGKEINTRTAATINKLKGAVPMLSLTYLASMLLKHGHEVKIVDAFVDNLTREGLKQRIKEFNPAVVGIHTMTPTFKGSMETATVAKECGCKVVLGGPHLAIFPQETLSYNCVDFGIIGEGEYPLLYLVEALEKSKSYEKIKGLVYKKNRKVISNGPAINEDLDSLPWPAFHLLQMHKYYSIIGLRPLITMVSSRGCPFHCDFCFKQPADKKVRFRDPVKFVDEMEYWVEKYGVKEIYIYDDTFTLNRNHVVKICKEILKRKLNVAWESPTRIDCVDLELLKLMRKAGCRRLRYGVDSGDEKILKEMQKGVTKEQIRNAFKWTKEAGIDAFGYVIIGYLHETPKTMKASIEFIKELDPTYALFTVAMPFPATPLFYRSVKEGLIPEDYWRNFVLGKETRRIPRLVKDTDKWVKKAYMSYYFRPRFILREIKKMKDWYEIKKRIIAVKDLLFKFKVSD